MKTHQLADELGLDLRLESGPNPTDSVLITVADGIGSRSLLVREGIVRIVDPRDYLKDSLRGGTAPAAERSRPAVTAAYWTAIAVLIGIVGLTLSGLVQLRIVLTGSMTPAVNAGDVLIGLNPSWREPAIGDVVIYTARRFDGSEVASFAHRIIAGDATGFTMKGDANPEPDVGKPTVDDIDSVVVWRIPAVGRLFDPRTFSLVLLSVVAGWLIWTGVRGEE